MINKDWEVNYENFVPLIKMVASFSLPTRHTCDLRVLVDLGATDNFIHDKVMKEFKIKAQTLTRPQKVTLRSEGSSA
eukprot:3801040-Rhodomonas_salina.3